MELFATHGYRGASLDMIAAQLGVTRQALLYYFPTKVKLLLAVLELRDQEDTAFFSRLAQQHDWSLGEALAAILRHNIEHPEFARLYTVLAAEAVEPDHPAHSWFVDRYRRVRTRVAAAVSAQQAGSVSEIVLPPESVAVAVLALLDGLQLQALLEPGVVQDGHALEILLALVAGGGDPHSQRSPHAR